MLVPLADAAEHRWGEKGDVLTRAGEEALGVWIILNGLARVGGQGDGGERIYWFLEPGDMIGEIALLDGLPYSVDTVLQERCLFLFIEAAPFLRMIFSSPSSTRHLVHMLCERIRKCTSHIGEMSFMNLRERLCSRLAELAIGHSEITDGRAVFQRRFTQTELSSLVGASREAVNRQLTALSREGLLAMRGGMIEIPDLKALTADLPGPHWRTRWPAPQEAAG